MATTTPVLGLFKPTVGADDDDWGAFWNSNADTLDAALVGGGPFLPLTGGTVTGPVTFSAGLSANRVMGNADGSQQFFGMGATADFTKNWLFGNTYWYGGTVTTGDALAGGEVAANKLLFTDAAIISAADAHGFLVQSVVPGAIDPANTATRSGLHNKMAVTGQIGATPTLGPGIVPANFASHLSIVYATGTQGGLGGWTAANNPGVGYYRGSVFAGNDIAWLADGASNYWMIVGREIDVQIQGTSSVYQRIGMLEVSANSTKQAAGDDCGLMFVVQFQNAFNHKNGIQFGASTGFFQATDSLIKAVPVTYPTPTTPTYNNGVNFASVNFTGNAFSSPGFAVNGSGRITANGGMDFGTTVAGTVSDLSQHLAIYSGYAGLNVTGGSLNVISGGSTQLVNGGVAVATFTAAGTMRLTAGMGLFNATAVTTKPTVTGSKAANAALASLLTALATYGLVTDSSS